MQEDHGAEQYFFDEPTLARLGEFVLQHGGPSPVLLCAPMLGQHLWERRHQVTVLDIDTRFSGLPGFRRWDIHRPEPLLVKPSLILCDPPFFNVKLDRLYRALTTLAWEDVSVPLALMWLTRREAALLGTLSRFGLRPTGFRPGYVSVGPDVGVQVYANLEGLP